MYFNESILHLLKQSGNTALIYATTGNNPHTTNELLLNNADFSIVNIYGDSAYSVAVKKQNFVGKTYATHYWICYLEV